MRHLTFIAILLGASAAAGALPISQSDRVMQRIERRGLSRQALNRIQAGNGDTRMAMRGVGGHDVQWSHLTETERVDMAKHINKQDKRAQTSLLVGVADRHLADHQSKMAGYKAQLSGLQAGSPEHAKLSGELAHHQEKETFWQGQRHGLQNNGHWSKGK